LGISSNYFTTLNFNYMKNDWFLLDISLKLIYSNIVEMYFSHLLNFLHHPLKRPEYPSCFLGSERHSLSRNRVCKKSDRLADLKTQASPRENLNFLTFAMWVANSYPIYMHGPSYTNSTHFHQLFFPLSNPPKIGDFGHFGVRKSQSKHLWAPQTSQWGECKGNVTLKPKVVITGPVIEPESLSVQSSSGWTEIQMDRNIFN
jgi:hypothetical protein